MFYVFPTLDNVSMYIFPLLTSVGGYNLHAY